jgi:tryptophanyl-tRNA synthetase
MDKAVKNPRILSGIQPSGALHLGNYFGAIKQYIELQEQGDALYFLANYHALTSVQDPEQLRQYTYDAAADLLALGLDPDRATLFRQSDVPEVTELTWVFFCVTGKGLLDRAVSFKDKIAKGLTPNLGLYNYPVLQAADILIYRSHLVPVGRDQQQHLEITRDIAGYFNQIYGEVFPVPDARYNETPNVPGTTKDEDGSFQKMSKSYGNAVELFLERKPLKKKIMTIQTDSTPVDDPKDPETDIVFALYKLFATPDERDELAERYRAGGMGYGDAKKRLLEKAEAFLGPLRERRKALKPDEVEDVLQAGAQRARQLAQETMEEVYKVTGIVKMKAR